MSQVRRRIFINSDLVSEIDHLSQHEPTHFISQNGSVPLYVMMNLQRPARSVTDLELEDVNVDEEILQSQELHELHDDQDADLIQHIETHPELFRAIPFMLEDGTEAVAFDLVRPRLYTVREVKDEADWRQVMKTYDPTWLVGPYIPDHKKK